MNTKHQRILTAEVILRSQSGKEPSPNAIITADTLHEYEPSPAVVVEAQRQLTALGFEVTPMIGISFSITAVQEIFEQVFHVALKENQQGGIEIFKDNRALGYELPIVNFPKYLQTWVYAVTFSSPLDFGPGDFYR